MIGAARDIWTRLLRMRAAVLALGLTLCATPATTQTLAELAAQAQQAAQNVATAQIALEQSKTAKDRVRALTDTIGSFEQGLAVLRDSLRNVTTQKTSLQTRLDTQEDTYARLLGVLLTIDKTPVQTQILHPDGPLTTARSSMLVADVIPALRSRVDTLRAEMETLVYLNDLQAQIFQDLTDGLSQLQIARSELTRAITDRTDLPQRFTADPKQTEILLAASDTLAIFAQGLDMIAVDMAQTSLPSILDRKGTLALPAPGRIIRYFNEPDAAGIARPGIILATQAQAIVTSPTAATIRYRGPLLDYGLVTILEPQTGVLFVIAGLDQVYGDIGQVVPAGSPIGMMGGNSQTIDAILDQSGENTGTIRSETLYIEVRQDQKPQNPTEWFRIGE